MSRRSPPQDIAASTRARLLNLAKSRDEDFQYVLTRYGVERLLYRLSQSQVSDQFVLKGATLFAVWTDVVHRPTRDVDLLSTGAPDLERVAALFRSICVEPFEADGVVFDPGSVRAERIREDRLYEAVRILLCGHLGRARIDIQIDVGFGDALVPAPKPVRLPTLLGLPAPLLQAYAKETVVAEKLHAMVELGMANSRMKDFFDLAFMATHFEFDRETLAEAIQATFARRGTAMPDVPPVAFTGAFVDDPSKRDQWRAFLRRSRLKSERDLRGVVDLISQLVWPILGEGGRRPRPGSWAPPFGWT